MEDCKAIFEGIYEKKAWGYGSGGGSDPENAAPYVDFIERYLYHYQPSRVIDIGCGDLRIAASIDFGSTRSAYFGYDVAQPEKLAKMSHGFITWGFDVLRNYPTHADLVLCKEVLQHLSNAQVQLLLDRTAHYKRRLFTSMTGEGTNTDIPCGGSRPVDLSKAPFYQNCRTVLTYGTNATWIVQELTNP